MHDVEDTKTLTTWQIFVCHVDNSVLLGRIPDQHQAQSSVSV